MFKNEEELYKVLLELYKQKGEYITNIDLAEKYSCCSATLRKNMEKVSNFENCPDVFLFIKKTLRNFEELNSLSAYWLGYIFADGSITYFSSIKRTLRLMLEVQTRDREILEKFCDFLERRKERITLGHNQKSVALSLALKSFSVSPMDYGVKLHKSHVREQHIPKEMLKEEDLFFKFFKGLVDGDGTIHNYRHWKGISLVSNSDILLLEIKNKLQKCLPVPTSVYLYTNTIETQRKQGKNATQNLYKLQIGVGGHEGKNIKFLYNKMFNDNYIVLQRKHSLLLELVKKYD